jgi:hypothetical protein
LFFDCSFDEVVKIFGAELENTLEN